jgi:phosphate/sulfate permease
LTHVDFVNGFTTELSSGMTVVLASYLKVPVSSTHCQGAAEWERRRENRRKKSHIISFFLSAVGAIVGVGVVPDSEKVEAGVHGVNWKMFGKIAASWLITVPVSGVVAGLLAWVLAKFITV